jgi:nitrogen fixation protein FixH
MTSTSGALHVELRTSPQPPAVGNDDVQILVTDSSGTPRDGLTVTVKPWMPAHDHGTSQTTVTPQGGGKYLVTNVYLYMSGVWQLQIGFSGPVSDNASAQFELP